MRLLTLFAFFFVQPLLIFCEQSLEYVSITEGKENKTNWNIQKTESGFEALSSSLPSHEKTTIQLSPTYTLFQIEQENPVKAQTFKAHRENDLLITSCVVKQKSKTKTHKIGQKAWVQEFTFGFKDFLASSDREYKFEILHPQNLDMHDMIAIKQYEEDLTIDGTAYKALKMKITLQGFKGKFWKADAWYDRETHRLLRYRANEGPGTPITETLFLQAKENLK